MRELLSAYHYNAWILPALLLLPMGGAVLALLAALHGWVYGVLAVHAVVLLGLGVALFAAPAQTAPLWPWKLTPLLAQATGAWLISFGVAAAHALLERDARRLRPAAVGYVLLAVLQSIALARYPHLFEWRSVSGVVYLIFLATMLLTGAVGLARSARDRIA